jgi:3-oxoacyl-[acyl-carrier protein] reductase
MGAKRRAIVTGASKGIGEAIARTLASRGYDLLLVARSSDRLNALAGELASTHAISAFAHPADLRERGQADMIAARAVQDLGGIDLLVNCAGATKRGDFFSLSDDDFLDGFALKFHGAVSLTRAVWPLLQEADAGHVINIIGAGGRTPSADFAIGGAVNSALMNFTKAMADRGLADGVRVNAINPGPVETDRLQSRITRFAEEQRLSADAARMELVRKEQVIRFDRPEEVASLVAFMDSIEGALLHGSIVDLDGGATKGL